MTIFYLLLVTGTSIGLSKGIFEKTNKIAKQIKIYDHCQDIIKIDCGTPGSLICQVTIDGSDRYTVYQGTACIISVTTNLNYPIRSEVK